LPKRLLDLSINLTSLRQFYATQLPSIFRRREDPVELHPKYHSLFRNITINCSVHCWNLE
jgi:hypothetical protein